MLLTATYPICDLRALCGDEHALPTPSGRSAAADFLTEPGASGEVRVVPRFGPVKPAGSRMRTRGAPGNPLVCDAARAIRIVTWPLGDTPGPFRVVFRDLCAEGDVLRRFDLGLATRPGEARLHCSVGEIARRFSNVKIAVRAAHRAAPLSLVHARFAIARAYAEATTLPGQERQLAPDVVVPADPVFFVVWSEGEGLSEDGAPQLAPVDGHPGLFVGRAPLTIAGPTSCVWYIKSTTISVGRASESRAAIADLCAQRACLRVALGQIEDGRLSPPPNPRREEGPAGPMPGESRPRFRDAMLFDSRSYAAGTGPLDSLSHPAEGVPALTALGGVLREWMPHRGAPAGPLSPSDRLQSYLDRALSVIDRRGRKVPVRTEPLVFDPPAGETRLTARASFEPLDSALRALRVRGTLHRRLLAHAEHEATGGEAARVAVAPPSPPSGIGITIFPGASATPITTSGTEALGESPTFEPPSCSFGTPCVPVLPAFVAQLQARLGARGKERVSPDERVTFAIELRYDQAFPASGGFESTGTVPFAIPEGAEERRLQVHVGSTDFEPRARDAWTTTVILRRDGPTPSTWEFEGIARGDRPWYTLLATFVLDGQPVGTLAVTLGRRDSDVKPPAGDATALTISLQNTDAAPPAIHIHIAPAVRGLDVTWALCDGTSGGPWSIDYDTSLHWNALSGKQYQSRSALGDLSLGIAAEMDRDLLSAIESTAGGTVVVVSRDPVFPFELVAPGYDRPFLGATCAFARWTTRPDLKPLAEPRILVKKAACIRPDYLHSPLPSAADEEEALRRFIRDLDPVRDIGGFKTLLQRRDVGLVHFAGHAEDNPPALKLGDQEKATPGQFFRAPLAESRPFLFVNGCRAAMAQPTLPPSRGNMIQVLLSANLAGVVAPFITVNSKAARAAAEKFYESAFSGKTIAEAVRDIHALADADPENAATYMSYLAYTPPSLRLELDKPPS